MMITLAHDKTTYQTWITEYENDPAYQHGVKREQVNRYREHVRRLSDTDDTTWLRVVDLLKRGDGFLYHWRAQDRRSFWFIGDTPDLPGDTDVFLSLNATRNAKCDYERATNADLHIINALYADLDRKHRDTDVPNLPIAPNLLVETSPGNYYGLWILTEPFVIENDDDLERMRRLQRALVEMLPADPAAKDLARSVRVPGTHNGKYDARPAVTIAESNLCALYAVADIESRTGALNRPIRTQVDPSAYKNVTISDDAKRYAIDRALQLAVETAHTERHTGGVDLACQLRDNRIDPTTAESVMLRYVQLANETNPGAEPYTEREALDTLNSIIDTPARAPSAFSLDDETEAFLSELSLESEPTPLDDARQQYADAALSHENGVLVLTGTPGSGKSTQVFNVVTEKHEGIAWFVARHNQESSLDFAANGFTSIRGRSTDNCDRMDMVKAASVKRVSVAKTVCSPANGETRPGQFRCAIPRSECPYWQQWQGERLVLPFASIQSDLWHKDKDIGVVCMDEVDVAHLTDVDTITPEMLLEWDDVYGLAELGKRFYEFLGTCDVQSPHQLADNALYAALDTVLTADNFIGGFTELLYVLVDHDLHERENVADADSKDDYLTKLPDRRLGDFLGTLAHELKLHRDGVQFVSRITVRDHKIYHHRRMTIPSEAFERPVIIMNATGDVDAIRCCMPDSAPFTEVAPRLSLQPGTSVEYHIGRNHTSTWLNQSDENIEQWIEDIEGVVRDDEETLLICKKNYADLLRERFPNCAVAHYGAVAGLNEYGGYDAVVLTQPLNPPPFASEERYRCVYGGNEGAPLNTATVRNVARLSGDVQTVEYTVLDARLHRIYDHMRNAEHIQALHRIRPILEPAHGKAKRVVIMFGYRIADLQAIEVAQYPDKRSRKEKVADAVIELIEARCYATKRDVYNDFGISRPTVNKYWNEIAQEHGLIEVDIKQLTSGGKQSCKALV